MRLEVAETMLIVVSALLFCNKPFPTWGLPCLGVEASHMIEYIVLLISVEATPSKGGVRVTALASPNTL